MCIIKGLKAEIYRGDINCLNLKIIAIKKEFYYAIEDPFKITKFYGNSNIKD